LAKRNALFYQQVHLVELDLLLGGRRMPVRGPLPPGDYYYLVARAEDRTEERLECQVYAWGLTDPLPRLPVPLRRPDRDVLIARAAVFTTAYARGRFARRLAYDRPCPAPLSDAQRVRTTAPLAR